MHTWTLTHAGFRGGPLWLRGGFMAVALLLVNVARTWAELTPRQAANLELGGLLLAAAFTIEAAGAALGGASLEAVTVLGRVIGQGLRQGGFTGIVVAVSASTVLLSGVAVSLLVAGAAAIVVTTILAPRIAEILRESHPIVAPTPFPTGPGTEEIPGTPWAEITFPDPLPYPGWLPHPPLLAGCVPPGSFVCWDYGFDGVPPGFWWQYDHWPHHPPFILPPPDYTPWWERGLEAEFMMLAAAEEAEGFVEADFLFGPDGRPRGFAFDDTNDPALNDAVADLVGRLPGGGTVALGDITDPAYVASVLNPAPPSASIPTPATLVLLTLGFAVAARRLRRGSR